jgi:hypothetical protein
VTSLPQPALITLRYEEMVRQPAEVERTTGEELRRVGYGA